MNESLSIVVPMAGRGQRFVDAGYSDIKPFIDVNGKTMIERVLEGLHLENAQTVLVVREDFFPAYASRIQYLQQHFNVSYAIVSGVTLGAACTVLAARQLIGEGPLCVADSDTLFRPPLFKNFVEDAIQRDLEISLLAMKSSEPVYSYAKTDSSGVITDIAEKDVISPYALCGAYWLKNKTDFIDAVIDLMIYGKLVKGEYYLSQVCRELVIKNKKSGIYLADENDVICMGTPEQLNKHFQSIIY